MEFYLCSGFCQYPAGGMKPDADKGRAATTGLPAGCWELGDRRTMGTPGGGHDAFLPPKKSTSAFGIAVLALSPLSLELERERESHRSWRYEVRYS
jgi:hypothetical protein